MLLSIVNLLYCYVFSYVVYLNDFPISRDIQHQMHDMLRSVEERVHSHFFQIKLSEVPSSNVNENGMFSLLLDLIALLISIEVFDRFIAFIIVQTLPKVQLKVGSCCQVNLVSTLVLCVSEVSPFVLAICVTRINSIRTYFNISLLFQSLLISFTFIESFSPSVRCAPLLYLQFSYHSLSTYDKHRLIEIHLHSDAGPSNNLENPLTR